MNQPRPSKPPSLAAPSHAQPQDPAGEPRAALPGAGPSLPDGSHASSLEEAMSTFSRVSEDLLAGYEQLREKAERMEAELVRTNEELASKVAELEAVLQALPSGVLLRGADGRVLRTNDALEALIGRSSLDILGERELREVSNGQILDANPTEQLLELAREDGLRLVVARRSSRVVTLDGQRLGSIDVLDDRTALTEMSERVHQLDKMAALGTMAGGIAHEIRNPMNAIKGFAHLICRQVDPSTTVYRFADRICEGVAEADAIISSMLTLAAPEQIERESLSLADLVEDVARLCRQDLKIAEGERTIELRTEASKADLVADRIKLRQALRNLVQNAIDVQPEGGRVLLRAKKLPRETLFEVHDAGPGIETSLRRRVREPFFTTRAEGTGLGLSLVHTIAELHQGSLEISPSASELGGALLTLRLPNATSGMSHSEVQ